MKISLVEQMVCRFPKGMEGWRFYRIEYGGHAENCVCEGSIWLPADLNPDDVEVLLSDTAYLMLYTELPKKRASE